LSTGPRSVSVQTQAGSKLSVTVDERLVRAALADAMSGYTSLSTVPSAIDRTAAGDFTWPARRVADRGWCVGSDLRCSDTVGWSGAGEFEEGCDHGARDREESASAVDPWAVVCAGWVDETGGESRSGPTSSIPVVAVISRVDPTSASGAITEELGGLSHLTVVDLSWTPEGTEFDCLGPLGSDWLSDPQHVNVTGCPGVEAPQFQDAP